MSDNTNTEVNSTTTVNVLRLSKFVLDSVATRELPKAVSRPWTRQPTVLMKLDIEGTKVVFLTNIQSGASGEGLGWVDLSGEFPRLVGRYCSYLLPKQDGGTSQI